MGSHQRCWTVRERLPLSHGLDESSGRVALARNNFKKTHILYATDCFSSKPVIRQRIQIGQGVAFTCAITGAHELHILAIHSVAVVHDVDAKLAQIDADFNDCRFRIDAIEH